MRSPWVEARGAGANEDAAGEFSVAVRAGNEAAKKIREIAPRREDGGHLHGGMRRASPSLDLPFAPAGSTSALQERHCRPVARGRLRYSGRGRVMKICDMVQAYAAGSGGVKTYLHEKRRYLLAQTDCEHLLIVPGRTDRVTRDGRATTVEIEGPLVRGAGAYRFIGRVDKLLRILGREAPDLVEVGDPFLMPWVARYHRWRRRTPLVGFYHADFPRAYCRSYAERALGDAAGRAAEFLADAYARSLYGACDAVVAASPALHARLASWPLRRLDFVPLGIDLDGFHPRRRDRSLWAGLGVDPAARVLIYAGRLDAEKRSDLLVAAFRRARLPGPVALVLVGTGPLREKILASRREDPRIHLLPYQGDRRELARLLAAADLYATAGPHETFGLSVIEAQASGLAVVGVAAGALLDRVRPDTGWLAAPDSAESLARALETALRSDTARRGAAARRAVEAEFSWERTFGQLLGLYGGLLARPHSPPALREDLPCAG
jgi:alpha-1,6-mannosyltransferase